MMKKMSLRMKLFIVITLVVIITFSFVSAIVSYKSITMAKEDAFFLADEMSAKYSYEIKAELQAARVTSESLMTVFKTLIERDQADRDMLNAVLQNALIQKEYMNIVSYCVAFEPNKLDGKDAKYAGQYPLYDDTGRYAPYWSLHDGEIAVEPLSDFDQDDWYAGARDSGQEYITDPFFFNVQGTPVLMASLVFPIIIDDEFIGIVSSDMALDSLQKMVSQVNTSGLDEFTEIYSNSGIITAHPNDQYFNKSIYTTSAYNMLTHDVSKIPESQKKADLYLDQFTSDDKLTEEYASAAAFVENLNEYAEDPNNVSLDLALMPNDLAKDFLQLDKNRVKIAREATSAIENGEPYIVTEDGYYKVFTPIPFSEATNPWSVAVSVPISEVLHKSNEIRNYVILVSILGLVLIAAAIYFVTRNLTKPILKLADFAKQVGEGDLGVDIPEIQNNGEVGILTKAFRTMVERINGLVNKLTHNSEELEKKNEHLNELNVMLVEAKNQAEASNRAKSQFLSNMSHEMRTPLNAIVGMTSIGSRAKDIEKKDNAFHKIEDASTHLVSLVNDILDMSKMEANKLELSEVEFKIDKVIDDAVEMVSPQREDKQQTLIIEVDSTIPRTFVGDDFRLSQVIINLLSNAVKFTEEKGEIALRVSFKEKQEEIYTLLFEVSDTGIGISAEQKAKLFHIFEQADNSTSRSFGGTGLGLALSQRIVEIMNGDIWVDSEIGKGSTFFFTVKLKCIKNESEQDNVSQSNYDEGNFSHNANAAEKENTKAATRFDFSQKTILLVEDIEINKEIVVAMLEETNVTIDYAANGKEAYELFVKNPERYDLILMDIQMPVMDGLEATKLIREINQKIPIIAMTANVFTEDVDMYLNTGFNNHIGKPLDYELTLNLLGDYLN